MIPEDPMERFKILGEKIDELLRHLRSLDDHRMHVLLSLSRELEAAAQVSEDAHFPEHAKLLRNMAQRARAAGTKLELVK